MAGLSLRTTTPPIMLTIYHNPRCSKSRAALELVTRFAEHHDLHPNVVDYQKKPLSRLQLKELLRQLQSEKAASVRDMIRENEEAYATLDLAHADDEKLLDALAMHPILLQRPIVVFDNRAIIARPPELAHKVLIAP